MHENTTECEEFYDLCRWQDDGGLGPDPQWPVDDAQADGDVPAGRAA